MPDVRLSSRSLTPVLCAVGLACALQGEVQASDGGPRDVATAPRVFDIAPGELAEVLLNIVRQGHVPIAFDQRLVAGLRGPDIRGRLSVEDALRRALAAAGWHTRRTKAVPSSCAADRRLCRRREVRRWHRPCPPWWSPARARAM